MAEAVGRICEDLHTPSPPSPSRELLRFKLLPLSQGVEPAEVTKKRCHSAYLRRLTFAMPNAALSVPCYTPALHRQPCKLEAGRGARPEHFLKDYLGSEGRSVQAVRGGRDRDSIEDCQHRTS